MKHGFLLVLRKSAKSAEKLSAHFSATCLADLPRRSYAETGIQMKADLSRRSLMKADDPAGDGLPRRSDAKASERGAQPDENLQKPTERMPRREFRGFSRIQFAGIRAIGVVSGCNGIVTNPCLSKRFRLCEVFNDEWTRISFNCAACRMKQYIFTALVLVCTVLVISLVMIKHSDNAQRESDADAITDFSNRLASAQIQLAFCNGMVLSLSNRLDVYQSATLTLSNLLTEAESAIASDAKKITNLTRQVAELESENQTLGRRVTDLTNQVAGLTTQIVLTETNLARANKDNALLENRLRRDVAERVVIERKFNNLSELQTKMDYLKTHPGGETSAENIYFGLDVEVKSNAVHVIAPN
jgi:cell division protein FtsB